MTIKTIGFSYPLDYIARRGRTKKRSWMRGKTPVMIEHLSKSDFETAFCITCENEVRHVLMDHSGHYWWPVTVQGNDFQFFSSIRDGYHQALALISPAFGERYPHYYDVSELIREELYTGYPELQMASQLAAQNVRIVDDTRVYIRGGAPLLAYYRSAGSSSLTFDVFNEGFDFGCPLPAKLTTSGADWVDRSNFQTFVQYGQVLPVPYSSDQLSEIGADENKIEHAARVEEIRVADGSIARQFDPLALQLRLLCREFLDFLKWNPKIPDDLARYPDLLQGVLDREPSVSDCATTILDLDQWFGTLDYKYRSVLWRKHRYLRWRMELISSFCNRRNIPPPFVLSPAVEALLGEISGLA